MVEVMSEVGPAKPARLERLRLSPALLRIGGFSIALASVALCAVALVHQWDAVKTSIEHADYTLLLWSFLAASAGMTGLGVLWWRCLNTFGYAVDLDRTLAWYFAGELGKYVPGGIWPVLGRGELAYRKGGVSRATGYATTLISYAAMCVAAAAVCGGLALVLALDNRSPTWAWAVVALAPIGVLATHPFVFERVLGAASRLTRRSVGLTTPSWLRMQSLIATAVPTWLLVGLSSVLIAQALGYDQRPAQIGFAAVAAWIIGFLAVPVPAGAGLRELVFVGLAGLSSGRAVAVAAGARLILLCVDGSAGALASLDIRLRPGARTAQAMGRSLDPVPDEGPQVASAEE
jgi:hypothetical protein